MFAIIAWQLLKSPWKVFCFTQKPVTNDFQILWLLLLFRQAKNICSRWTNRGEWFAIKNLVCLRVCAWECLPNKVFNTLRKGRLTYRWSNTIFFKVMSIFSNFLAFPKVPKPICQSFIEKKYWQYSKYFSIRVFDIRLEYFLRFPTSLCIVKYSKLQTVKGNFAGAAEI